MLHQPDIARLLLRLTLGFLLLFHGLSKVIHGIGPIEGLVTAHGLPAALAWGVFIGEIVAPIMLIIGYQTRVGATLVIINMIFAIVLAHTHELMALKSNGGWALELQALFLMNALVILLMGPGKHRMHS